MTAPDVPQVFAEPSLEVGDTHSFHDYKIVITSHIPYTEFPTGSSDEAFQWVNPESP